MTLLEKLNQKATEKQIRKEIDLFDSICRSYKVHLWDIEHDNLPENEAIRNEWIRVVLVGTNSANLEEYCIFAENEIKKYENEIKKRYDQLAKLSKWRPAE